MANYEIIGISATGEEDAGYHASSLEEARAWAETLLRDAGNFTAWVQGEGVNECHHVEDGVVLVGEEPKNYCEKCGSEMDGNNSCPACGGQWEE